MSTVPAKLLTITLAALFLQGITASDSLAAFEITFQNGDDFDGDVAGDTVDLGSGIEITTVALNASANSLNTINNSGGALGIDSSGTSDSQGNIDEININAGTELEFWSFSFNLAVNFLELDFAGLQNSETMTLGSDAWIGLNFLTPGLDTSFDSATGVFTLDGGDFGGDNFVFGTINGTPLTVPAGETITIGADSPGNGARIQSMTLAAVPEPGSLFTWLPILGLLSSMAATRRPEINQA